MESFEHRRIIMAFSFMTKFSGFRIPFPTEAEHLERTGDGDFVKASPLYLQNRSLLEQLMLLPGKYVDIPPFLCRI